MQTWKSVWMLAGSSLLACSSFVFESDKYEDTNRTRLSDQTYFEDSSRVFFLEQPNAFSDKELLAFASYLNGELEMRVMDVATDSVRFIYRFEQQASRLFIVAYRPHPDRIVKCVLYVDGRPKSARLFAFEHPIAIQQWKTKYTLEEF